MTVTLQVPNSKTSEKCKTCVGEKIIGNPCIANGGKECSMIASKSKTCSIEKAFNAFLKWNDEQEYI